MNSSYSSTEVNGFGEHPRVNGERRTIPFDYAFRYELEGKREKVHNDTVTVSIESTFTAVSIGYGVVPKVTPLVFDATRGGEQCIDFSSLTTGSNPRIIDGVALWVLTGGVLDLNTTIAPGPLGGLVIPAPVTPSGQIEIRFPFGCSLVELTFAMSGAGSVSIKAKNEDGTILPIPILPTPPTFTATLTASSIVEITITANSGLDLLRLLLNRLCFEQSRIPLRGITLGDVLGSLENRLPSTFASLKGQAGAEAALRNGFKLNPVVAEAALLGANKQPPPFLDESILARLFQVVGAPPDQIQFLYSIFDEGSGREFQSEPILNIAGLGTADGMRPFRYFARPIQFTPQSAIRMQVTEVSEFAGELHVSLQGYKTLGARGTPTDPRQVRRSGRIRR